MAKKGAKGKDKKVRVTNTGHNDLCHDQERVIWGTHRSIVAFVFYNINPLTLLAVSGHNDEHFSLAARKITHPRKHTMKPLQLTIFQVPVHNTC